MTKLYTPYKFYGATLFDDLELFHDILNKRNIWIFMLNQFREKAINHKNKMQDNTSRHNFECIWFVLLYIIAASKLTRYIKLHVNIFGVHSLIMHAPNEMYSILMFHISKYCILINNVYLHQLRKSISLNLPFLMYVFM